MNDPIGADLHRMHIDRGAVDFQPLRTRAFRPGWQATAVDLHGPVVHAVSAQTNVVCGATGRLRLTGRAVPAEHGTMRAWLVFECGTLAADQAAGTLGFGILESDDATVTARPVRISTDGSFTYRGTYFEPP